MPGNGYRLYLAKVQLHEEVGARGPLGDEHKYPPGADARLATIGGLASRLRVLAPDFPGWGPGGQLELGYSSAYLADFAGEYSRLETFHGVSHFLPAERPEEFNPAVLNFLAS